MPADAYPVSKSQMEWFYRRSGTIMRSPFMLNSDWFQPGEIVAPNLVAEAAKDFGVTDDRVRLALAHAAVREGKKVDRWDIAVAVAAVAVPTLSRDRLLARAQSPEVAARTQASTAELHALQVTQRPAFLLENSIGDRAVFSGVVRAAPIAPTLDAMLADEAAYVSWRAHFGDPPAG